MKKIFLHNILILFFMPILFAGQLDTSFGTNGIVVTSIGRLDYINSVSLLSTTSQIVVAGATTTNAAIKLAVARYNNDGSLDTSFNSTGIQTTLIGSHTEGNGVALQTDNKIIVGGFSSNSVTSFALVRYNTNGSLDSTFNTTGFVLTTTGAGCAINSVKIQNDGFIVAAGAAVLDSPQFALARYDTTGALDTTFGAGGIVLTPIGMQAVISEIALQADGKIVASGYTFNGGVVQFALARYNTDGSLDTGFGSGGIVTTSLSPHAQAQAVAIQGDGKIVVSGYTFDDSSEISLFAVVRYDSSGNLDTSFGGTGIVTTQIQNSAESFAVALQSDGKIIAAGFSIGDVPIQFALARYNTDGSLDNTYGTNGIVTTTIGDNLSESHINAIAIQPDDKCVAAGFSDLDFALARYLV
jgi:uncharacterized delta-60 repeat protein